MKQHKRVLAGLLALLLCAPLVLWGCDKDEPVVDDEVENDIRYDYDLTEYMKVGEYKGLEYAKYPYVVTMEDVQQQILLARANYATVAEKADAAANGDQVDIDFVGYIDGEAFEGGSAEGYSLTLGSNSFIEGFEAGLVGYKAGDTVTLDLKFPTPYVNNPEMSGKAVQFVVTINKVYEQALPAYDDAFVKEHYGYDTIESFEKALFEAMTIQAENGRYSYIIQEIWQVLLKETEFISFPEKEFLAMYEDYVNYYTMLATEQGISLNEYVKNEFNLSVSEFYEEVESVVHVTMRQEMLLVYIARQENITLTEEEYEEGALEYAEYYGLSSIEELEQYYETRNIEQSLLFDKVYEFLVSNAVEKTE